jgi:hypothetical protein
MRRRGRPRNTRSSTLRRKRQSRNPEVVRFVRAVGQFEFCFFGFSPSGCVFRRFIILGPYGHFHRCEARDVPRLNLALQCGHWIIGLGTGSGLGIFGVLVKDRKPLRQRGHTQTTYQSLTSSLHAAQTFVPRSGSGFTSPSV